MATKSMILRPVGLASTADGITYAYTPKSATPSETAADSYYNLLTEETADGNSTCIAYTMDDVDPLGPGVFFDKSDKKPVSGRVVFAWWTYASGSSTLKVTVRLLDKNSPDVIFAEAQIAGAISSNGTAIATNYYAYTVEITDLDALTAFLASSVPTVVIAAVDPEEEKSGVATRYTQIYFEFEYEDGGYYAKDSGAWAENSGTIYQKSGGEWVEVDASTLVEGLYVLHAPTIISFTVHGVSYTAEEGMTWAQWVGSDYDTNGYILSGDNITDDAGNIVVDADYGMVNSGDIIQPGYSYFHIF